MTSEEIRANNMLILNSEFASSVHKVWLSKSDENTKDLLYQKIAYHKLWSSIMPVVEKINKVHVGNRPVIFTIGSCGIYIALNESNAMGYKYRPCIIANTLNVNYFACAPSEETPFVESVFIGVVQFVKWYRKNKNIKFEAI